MHTCLKKAAGLFAAGALLLGTSAVAESVTYQSTQQGHHGELTVQVTFEDGKVTACDVTACTDTHIIADAAVKNICANVVKYQTAQVDSVSGATLSSAALKRGVEDCFKQANFESAEKMPEAETLAHADEETDILVVGAGTSGIAAAMSAATGADGETPSEVKVTLIEKLPFAGGSFIVSGAGVFNAYGTAQHAAGEFDVMDEDTWVHYLNYRSGNDYLGLTNEGLQRKAYQAMNPVEDLLRKAGAPFSDEGLYYAEVMDMTFDGYSNNMLADICLDAPVFDALLSNFVEQNGYGSISDVVSEPFVGVVNARENIDMRLSTTAEELVTENGAVVGVRVLEKNLAENTQAEYVIRAKKVILATGSPNLNTDILKQYDEDFANAYPFCEVGQSGDGIVMMQNAGLEPVIQGTGGMCYNGASFQYGMEDGLALGLVGSPVVNTSGKRYYDEGITAPYDTGRQTMNQEKNTGYIIIDSQNPFYSGTSVNYGQAFKPSDETLFDYALRKGWVVKADTLEELAQAIGVDEQTFVQTIEAFNQAAQSGQPSELCAQPELMVPVLEAPFYAVTAHAFRVESYISLKTKDSSTQLVGADGETIENLYGCGTLIASNLYYDNYFNYSGGLTTALCTGYLAGEEAREALAENASMN